EPAIVSLQELAAGRLRSARRDQAVALAQALKTMVPFHPAITVTEERCGDAILTAVPSRLLTARRSPRLKGRLQLAPRGALWAEVDIAGASIQVINTHLGLFASERAAQVDVLLGADWIGAAMRKGPVLFSADL